MCFFCTTGDALMRMYRFKFKVLESQAFGFTEKVMLKVNEWGRGVGGGQRKQVLSAGASAPSSGSLKVTRLH